MSTHTSTGPNATDTAAKAIVAKLSTVVASVVPPTVHMVRRSPRLCEISHTPGERKIAVGAVRKNPADFGFAELNEIGIFRIAAACPKIMILQNGLQNETANVVPSRGAPEEIRTPDPQIRSLVLYPAELRAPLRVAPEDPMRSFVPKDADSSRELDL
jgi:hypothetical protein